jgi:choline dehydrogenase-like flavoprotein
MTPRSYLPWALHPMDYTGDPEKDYLITSGPDAKAYQQNYVRYVGGATWHWAGTLWRLTPEDMMLNSKFGVGRDWPFDYSVLEPYYVRAEYAIGAAGPSIANSSDQVGRNMMDTPKIFVLAKFKDPVWGGLGPVQTCAIMSTSQGDFRSRHAGGQISLRILRLCPDALQWIFSRTRRNTKNCVN